MEVILITPNPKYQTLVSPSKTIQSQVVDIGPLVESQVFLSQHSNLSVYCLKNNFPYQFHCPLQICTLLLQRQQGPVQLFISNGQYYKMDANDDHLEVLVGIQAALQEDVACVGFTAQGWDVQVRFVVINQLCQELKVKEAILAIGASNTPVTTDVEEVARVVLFVDENNYEDFLGWSENQSDFYDFQLKERLSKEYMTLKQEIDNEKNLFRNKIKMVETILGQNINIDKLLTEQKQENQQYKRLKETFETIKNIDNVIIQQQKRIQAKKQQLKQKVQQKHTSHYQNAKKFAKSKTQISQLTKQIQQLQYTISRVNQDKPAYNLHRNFQLSAQTRQVLTQQVNKCKQIAKSISGFYNGNHRRNYSRDLAEIGKAKIIQSVHNSSIKMAEKYRSELKKKVSHHVAIQSDTSKLKIAQMCEQMDKYENLLLSMVDYLDKNNYLLSQIQQKDTQKDTQNTQKPPKQRTSMPPSYTWDPQQFVVLSQIVQGNKFTLAFNQTATQNMNPTSNYIGSSFSISRKSPSFVLLEDIKKGNQEKSGSVSQVSIAAGKSTPGEYSKTKKTLPAAEPSKKLIKTKIKPSFQKQNKSAVHPR